MDKKSKTNIDIPRGIDKLREEHMKVVKDCDSQIQHWKKVEGDYDALEDRLRTLPDKLSYDIMVPFGPLAFMPGKMVHTNEVTVLLGDNWFAKCSAKQAQEIVGHRKQHVKGALDDLQKTRKNFEARVHFTQDLGKLSEGKGDYVDIREEVESQEKISVSKGKQRVAHKPHSKPKLEAVVALEEDNEGRSGGGGDAASSRGVLSEEELWAKLDELEKLEEQQDEQDRSGSVVNNGEDSSSSEEEKERGHHENGLDQGEGWKPAPLSRQINGGTVPPARGDAEEDEEDEGSSLPTIYFSHTVEPKKVRINTGKNTTLKFSEKKEQKEQAKRRKKNGGSSSNGHSHHEHYKITSPTDVYRLFVDVKNGELVPRKSILKSRSRENSVCSDTSESSAADFEERRALMRSQSHDDTTHSDTSDGITEEDSPTGGGNSTASHFEAFSGTVVEKDPLPSSTPHLTLAPPALPTIPERRLEEVGPEPPQEPPKRVSKFKASRLQQK